MSETSRLGHQTQKQPILSFLIKKKDKDKDILHHTYSLLPNGIEVSNESVR